ncbi:hypothetical protein [Paenibacillus kandeliae]|uniref:hypothetical protein n=1 Tax=Paenibacillus kandeliae TaxID=3231269 RepID=UPI0034592825
MQNFFTELIEKVDYDLIPGLSSEMRDCLAYEDKVLDFQIATSKDKVYHLHVKLHEYTLSNAKSVFSSLLQFIQYNSTFYIRRDTEHNTEYLLLSQQDDNLAFYCKILFTSHE